MCATVIVERHIQGYRTVLARTEAVLARRTARTDQLRRELSQVADEAARLTKVSRDRRSHSRPAVALPEDTAIAAGPAPAEWSDAGNRAIIQLRALETDLDAAADDFGMLMAAARDTATSCALPPARGWQWPVRGVVSSGFGSRTDPLHGGPATHRGIDLKGHFGEPVRASADGTVVFAGRQGGYGNAVVVDHGGNIKTLYGHLAMLWVRPGQRVRGGDAVGGMGQTGRATGVHCHFEMRVAGQAVNPHTYVTGTMLAAVPVAARPAPRARIIRLGDLLPRVAYHDHGLLTD